MNQRKSLSDKNNLNINLTADTHVTKIAIGLYITVCIVAFTSLIKTLKITK